MICILFFIADKSVRQIAACTPRPVARKGYGSIAHEAKLNGLCPASRTEKAIIKLANAS